MPMRVIAKKRCRAMVEPPEKGERATLNPNLSTRLKPTFFPTACLLYLNASLRSSDCHLLTSKLRHLGGNSDLPFAGIRQRVGSSLQSEGENSDCNRSQRGNDPTRLVENVSDLDADFVVTRDERKNQNDKGSASKERAETVGSPVAICAIIPHRRAAACAGAAVGQ